MLKNPRHEKFAQMMAKAQVSATEAYIAISGNNSKAARAMASKWLTRVDVENRINELRQKAADKAEFDLKALLEFCVGLVTLKPGNFDKDSQYAQVTIKEGPNGMEKEYKMMDKGKALALLAEIGGYLRPAVQETAAQITGAAVIINLPPLLMQPRRVAGKTIDQPESGK